VSGISFEVEVVEESGAGRIRYRDAVRLGDGDALLVMTDGVDGGALEASITKTWKERVRAEASRGKGPEVLLQLLNETAFAAGVMVVAACARLDARERFVKIACAGAPAPFILRADARVTRPQTTSTIPLGRVRSAKFFERALQLGPGDTLLVPSVGWSPVVEGALAGLTERPASVADWLRAHGTHPIGGSLLCLALS
jgi:hypothetical protein